MGDGCRQQLCIQNCGQITADRDIVITYNLSELVIAIRPIQ